MMKILFLAHLFPLPLDSGGKIKSYHMLRTLASRHEVHVLAYVRTRQERELVDELQKICSGIDIVELVRNKSRQVFDAATGLFGKRSFIIARDDRPDLREAFLSLVQRVKPDVVHVDHLQMAQFVDYKAPYKIVLDHHNVESMIIKRISSTAASYFTRTYASHEWPKLQNFELEACRRSDLVITVSEEDKSLLQKLDSSITNITTIPIGVDVKHYSPVRGSFHSKNILSLGTMYWPPNIDSMLYFYNEVYPIVRKQVPECTLTIAGQRPVASIQALATDPAVKVTGYLEDDRTIAQDCGVFIVPLRSGSGVRVKILNALAMGLPVVSTSIGAEGLEVENGKDILLADTPQEFAEATARVLLNKELAQSLGTNGRRLVCEKYSWDVVGERLLNIYEHKLGAPDLVMSETI